jgi:hypothetical protein
MLSLRKSVNHFGKGFQRLKHQFDIAIANAQTNSNYKETINYITIK